MSARSHASKRDPRVRVVLWVLAAIALGGAALAWLPLRADAPARATRHETEIHQRFMQGVAMLHAKRHEHALTAFHRVLELAPEMPEAHVNMGYALLGLERDAAARDFFESALALKRDQLNAYYGLALALERLHDLPGAVGALRTYVHLTRSGGPHLRKAQSALWEWEAALARARSDTPPPAQ